MSNNISTEKSIMPIEQIDLISSFESMPNELLMELFEYYDLYSLFYSFGSLNSRISNIIYHCPIYVDLDRIELDNLIHFLSYILPEINPKNIQSLHSTNSDKLLTLIYDKSLNYFTEIRLLSLNCIRPTIIQELVSRIDFFYLERVVLNKHGFEYQGSRSFFKHFLNSNRYPFLRFYKDFRGSIERLTSVLSIESATILDFSIPSNLLNFLNQTPNLKYLKGKLKFNDTDRESIFSGPIRSYRRLTHFNLEIFDKICMKTIIYLFKCAPEISNLKLKIQLRGSPEFTDPIFWETTLSNYLPKLKQLRLFVCTRDSKNSNNPHWIFIQNKDEISKEIKKSNYWSSHPWKTIFNSGSPMDYIDFYWAKFEVC